MSKLKVLSSGLYRSWYKTLNESEQVAVDTRIDTYITQGRLINVRPVAQKLCLYEFKWGNGLKVYFSFIKKEKGQLMLLLSGGEKASMDSDVQGAKALIKPIEKKVKTKKPKAK